MRIIVHFLVLLSFFLFIKGGLIGRWDFQEGEGKLAKDSINGRDITLFGENGWDSRGFYRFSNSNGRFSLNIAQSFTIMFWIKFDVLKNGIVIGGGTPENPSSMHVSVIMGSLYFSYGDLTLKSGGMNTSTWTHVAFSCDSDTCITYINALMTNKGNVEHARQLSDAFIPQHGASMDNIEIYDVVLTEEEISRSLSANNIRQASNDNTNINVSRIITFPGSSRLSCPLCGFQNYLCNNETNWNQAYNITDPREEHEQHDIVGIELVTPIQARWCSVGSSFSISVGDTQFASIQGSSLLNGCDCSDCSNVNSTTKIINVIDLARLSNTSIGSINQFQLNSTGVGCLVVLQVIFTLQKRSTSSPTTPTPKNSSSSSIITYVIVAAALVILVVVVVCVVIYLRMRKRKSPVQQDVPLQENFYKDQYTDIRAARPVASNDNPSFGDYNLIVEPDKFNPQYGNETYAVIQPSDLSNTQGSHYTRFFSEEPQWKIKFEELEFTKELGRGGYGVVQLGIWRSSNVAIKMMIASKSIGTSEYTNFIQEAQILSNLRPHSNIIQFQGACIDPGQPLCIVTEYMSMGDLFEYVQNNKLEEKPLYNIIRGIAAGMQHLQSEGVVHRDLAARNVLLSRDLTPKISDFGMSRLTDVDESSITTTEIGPVKWMSPELLLHREYSVKSDVWSFGIVLMEILTRRMPYPDLNPTQAATLVVAKKAVPTLPSETNPIIMEVFNRCVVFEAPERADFNEVCEILNSLR